MTCSAMIYMIISSLIRSFEFEYKKNSIEYRQTLQCAKLVLVWTSCGVRTSHEKLQKECLSQKKKSCFFKLLKTLFFLLLLILENIFFSLKASRKHFLR